MAEVGEVAAGITESQVASGPRSTQQLEESSLVVAASARLGQSLRGKWRLDSVLGVGGMAAVYAATHRNGTRAAVKVLHQELVTVAQARQRFEWEGRVANAVGHPGAVQVLDDDVAEDGSPFLVTELLEGETLEDRRWRFGGRLPPEEVLVAMDMVLDVLVTAHARGIVHRDLKPENLFLTFDGHIKVLDFGIARRRGVSEETRLTQVGETLGTPAYMSPEHARGLWDELDGSSDLWSVGATMFQLLSGSPVRQGRTVNEELLEAMTRPAAPLSTLAPDVAPAIAAIVDRAMAMTKEDRWPDASAMREAIEVAYLALQGAPISEAPPMTAPSSALRPRGVPVARARVSSKPAAPTTDQPVEVPDRPPPVGFLHSVRSRIVAAAVGGFLVAGVMAGLIGYACSQGTEPVTTAAAPGEAPAPTSPVVLAPPVETIPEIAVSALPTAPPPEPSVAPVPSGQASSAKCSPPYTVDPKSGKKRWKIQCL
jgi:serine/threonine-protein kinase